MPGAYSPDMRGHVVEAVKEGASCRRAAGQFKVSTSPAIRWASRLTATGSCAPAPAGGDRKSKSVEARADWPLNLVRTEPGPTFAEIRERLREAHGLKKSLSCLWRFLDRRGIAFKKKTLHAAGRHRDDARAAREKWRANQPPLDPRRPVFIDETATKTNMARPRERAPEGGRPVGKAPHGHRRPRPSSRAWCAMRSPRPWPLMAP